MLAITIVHAVAPVCGCLNGSCWITAGGAPLCVGCTAAFIGEPTVYGLRGITPGARGVTPDGVAISEGTSTF